ncbi:hypothetical protein NKH52_04445 [Mesorhizobium sp. M1066]|uniref:hypothetical protein n=1 Tax=unclassified Mesorhizobium TaxID=325217 RepID=UPI00333DD95A
MPGLRIAVGIAFAVEGEQVLILSTFYAGRNITPELLEAGSKYAPVGNCSAVI